MQVIMVYGCTDESPITAQNDVHLIVDKTFWELLKWQWIESLGGFATYAAMHHKWQSTDDQHWLIVEKRINGLAFVCCLLNWYLHTFCAYNSNQLTLLILKAISGMWYFVVIARRYELTIIYYRFTRTRILHGNFMSVLNNHNDASIVE
jgi:hypothetical protein